MHGTYPALAAVRRALISLAVALPLTCYGIGVANATVLVPMSDADLVRSSQLIVIGGSLRKAGDRYVGEARRVVEREAFPQHRADVRIVEAALGDEAPAVGAGLIALERLPAV